MGRVDLTSLNPNKDPYTLWEELATRVRNNSSNNDVVAVTVCRKSEHGALNVQFKNSYKVYGYQDAEKICTLLTRTDAQWWRSQPF